MNIKRNIIFSSESRKKNGCTNKLKQSASEINADLLRYYTEVQSIFKEFEVKGIVPTTEQVKEALKAKNGFCPQICRNV